MVCLAVWLTYSARSTIDKIAAIIFPIAGFVASGFEHSVANMTLLTTALLGPSLDGMNLWGYFYNILLSTLGNLLGGIWGVALPYYLISREKK